MSKVYEFFSILSDILDGGWLSRIFLSAQFYLAFYMVDWAMSFANAALAVKADLLGTAAIITAVAAVPQALLMLATNKYIELRNLPTNNKYNVKPPNSLQ